MAVEQDLDEERIARNSRYAALAREPMRVVGRRRKALGGSWTSLKEIVAQHEMLGLLVRRDIKSRYKDSALGFVWSLIKPLTQLLIYYVVMGQFLGAARGINQFAIYIFAGLTAYSLFSEIISSATGSIVGNSGLVKKIYLPREIFPLASVGSALFNFAMQLVILLAATLLLRQFPISADIVYLAPALLVVVTFAFAFGLLLAALNVYMRDIQYLVEVVMMVLLWGSPIVYSWSMVRNILGDSLLFQLYTNNPITLAVLGFQRALWIAGQPDTPYPSHLFLRLVITFLVGTVLVVLFQRIFARLQGNFAQEL